MLLCHTPRDAAETMLMGGDRSPHFVCSRGNKLMQGSRIKLAIKG
jgi:hypothetical protein